MKSAKRCLRKTLGKALLDFEELLTVIVEIESTLNSRPICYIYDDTIDEVLTPSHLLFGRRLLGSCVDDVNPENVNVSSETLTRKAKQLNSLITRFWGIWSKEYLVGLREFHNSKNRLPGKQISVGEVVLISDEKLPRNRWKMAVVVEVHIGRDGFTRGCKLRTLTKNKGRIIHMNRPINKLHPLEIMPKEGGLS